MSRDATTPAVFEFHEAPTQPATRDRDRSDAEGALVLIVDDQQDARKMYSVCLEKLGYRTVCEASGEAGVERAIEMIPAAIVMDAAMPGMGGLEASRRLKSDPRTAKCPIILVTASDTAFFEEARAAGCDAYFCKPFNIFALDTIIRLVRKVETAPTTTAETTTVKECSCGKVYSIDQWMVLPLCGRMTAGRSQGSIVELRNCHCGSTLALPVPVR